MQSLPTSSFIGRASSLAIARQMLRAVGAGWQAPQESLNAADALALAASLDDGRLTLVACLDEAYQDTASETLGEWESLYGLPVVDGLNAADRRARLVATARSTPGGSPRAIVSALNYLTSSSSCAVNEAGAFGATSLGVFFFACVVPIGFVQSATKRAQVRALVDRMKPAHTNYSVANRVGFYCDGYLDTYLDTSALGS